MNNIKTYEGFFRNLFKKDKVSIDDIVEIFTYILDDDRIKCSLKNNVEFNSTQIDLDYIYKPDSDSISFEAEKIIHNTLIDLEKNKGYTKPFIYNNTTYIRIEYSTGIISNNSILEMVRSSEQRLLELGAKVTFFLFIPFKNPSEHFQKKPRLLKNISFSELKKYLSDLNKINIEDINDDDFLPKTVNIYFNIKNVKQ